VLSEQTDPRITPGWNISIGANLVTWRKGDLQKLIDLSKAIPDQQIHFEENLWWSDQTLEDRQKSVTLPGPSNWPQVLDVDPRLDDDRRPGSEPAQRFGVQPTG
jgi:hypothetical protein